MLGSLVTWPQQHRTINWTTWLLLVQLLATHGVSITHSSGCRNNTSANYSNELRMIPGTVVSLSSNNSSQGYIISPNYPRPYGSNTTAIAFLSADPDSNYDSIRLTFEDLDLEVSNYCDAEVIELLNYLPTNNTNWNSKSHSICGNTLPLPFLFKGRFLVIYFVTDMFASGKGRGFRIHFQFLNYTLQTFNGCPMANHYKCRNRRCIPNHLRCNRHDDCGDASDEDKSSGCQNLPTIAYPINYRCGTDHRTITETSYNNQLKNRINGGRRSNRLTGWPFQVSIQQVRVEPVSHFCGGTLIHPLFVMTAAHCFKEFSRVMDYKLVLGAKDLLDSDRSNYSLNSTRSRQVRYARFISLYPGNGIPIMLEDTALSHDHSNDLALIELNAPVQLDNNVWPACLPHLNEPIQAGRKCMTSGFGDTHGTGSPLALKHVVQTIEHQRECSSMYSNFRVDDYNMICVRSELGGGPCNGDSGGPLFCGDSENYNKPVTLTEGPQTLDLSEFLPGQIIQYFPVVSSDDSRNNGDKIRFTVHGITSFTTDGNANGGYCGLSKIPIIYARVSTKIEWIISKMKMAMRRLSKDDNQEDTNNRSSLFGYMFRTGRSRVANSPPLMTVDSNQ